VIPTGCFGYPGLALEACVDPVNPTECRFGNGTWREGFPWNLSGTYVQAMPYAYSVAARGSEHGSQADYCRTAQDLVPNVFPKGINGPGTPPGCRTSDQALSIRRSPGKIGPAAGCSRISTATRHLCPAICPSALIDWTRTQPPDRERQAPDSRCQSSGCII